MKLTVNRDKSKVGSPTQLKFLGFALYTKPDETKGIRIHPKSIKRFKARIKQITKRSRGRSFDVIVFELKRYTDGWLQYYGIADMKVIVRSLNGWIRRRLRCYIWKQWKKASARYRNLMKLKATRDNAWMWANTRKGHWRVAGSPILKSTITNELLERRGYADISKKYEKVHSSYRTAVYGSVRTVVWEDGWSTNGN